MLWIALWGVCRTTDLTYLIPRKPTCARKCTNDFYDTNKLLKQSGLDWFKLLKSVETQPKKPFGASIPSSKNVVHSTLRILKVVLRINVISVCYNDRISTNGVAMPNSFSGGGRKDGECNNSMDRSFPGDDE